MKASLESSLYQSAADATPVWLRRYTKFVAAATLFLIFAGAMVTSTGSGLAVPDWPNTYGWFLFAFPLSKMVGGIFYEHSHRMIAATVGMLTVIQAIWLQLREPKRVVRILGWLAVGAVIAQGVLGGLTVLFLLPPPISIAHAGLAEIFFCLNVAIAFFTSKLFVDLRAIDKGDAPVGFSSLLVALVYGQILIGALMRHLGAGLAIPDFPLSFGRVVPHFTSAAIAVNYAHRVGALVVAAAAVLMLVRVRRFELRHPLRQIVRGLLGVIPLQILLGGYTVWSGKSPLITSLHVMTGASTLALALLLALTARTVGWRARHIRVSDLLQLTKARIVLMVLITTAAGYFIAGGRSPVLLFNVLVGTALVAAGTNALNQYAEREYDALMRRTRLRPLPDGRLTPRAALLFAAMIATIGTAYLAFAVHWLAAFLGAFTLVSYIFVYTPLKRTTTLCTIIGAIPGAIPPMMGWAAARGELTLGAWIVFGILFLWQLPHFMAISWIYREDYARAGFAMTSVRDSDGSATARQAVLFTIALLLISVTPALLGIVAPAYLAGALVAGACLLAAAIGFQRARTNVAARRLFMTSNLYLVAVMVLLIVGA